MQIKSIKDYYEIMKQRFPEVDPKDIERIMNFGWKSLYLCNSYGGDTIVQDDNVWMYTGYLRNNSLEHFKYYIKKLAKKVRILSKRRKIPWDGYYYFALSEEQYQNYLSQKNKRGRPKKKFNYGNCFLYQLQKECEIKEANCRYIFRVPMISTTGYRNYIQDFISDKAELILVRDPLTFNDLINLKNKLWQTKQLKTALLEDQCKI